LRARGCRLRLYGVDGAFDPPQAIGCFGRLAPGRVRWRVLAVDSDGTMAIVVRAAGKNVAVEMLRCGAVAVRGTGARRYRLTQAGARLERRGMWRHVEHWPAQPEQVRGRFALPFPWWQG
jgi:endonuclease YncB( thermonuclease family)